MLKNNARVLRSSASCVDSIDGCSTHECIGVSGVCENVFGINLEYMNKIPEEKRKGTSVMQSITGRGKKKDKNMRESVRLTLPEPELCSSLH